MGSFGGLDSVASIETGSPCLSFWGGMAKELEKQMSMCVHLSSLSASNLGVGGTAAYPSLACTEQRVVLSNRRSFVGSHQLAHGALVRDTYLLSLASVWRR